MIEFLAATSLGLSLTAVAAWAADTPLLPRARIDRWVDALLAIPHDRTEW